MKDYITSEEQWVEKFYPYYKDIRDTEDSDVIDKALDILFYTRFDKLEDVAVESVYMFRYNLLKSIVDSGYRNTDSKDSNLHVYSRPVILGGSSKSNSLRKVSDKTHYRIWCDNILVPNDISDDSDPTKEVRSWEIVYSDHGVDLVSALDEYCLYINNKIFQEEVMLKDVTTVEKDYSNMKETISEVKTIISKPDDNNIIKVFKDIISIKELMNIITRSCIIYDDALKNYK